MTEPIPQTAELEAVVTPTVTYRAFLPTLLVFIGFLATLAGYVVLSIQGSDTGPFDELAIGLGGALAGVAAPTIAAHSPR